MQKLWWTIKMFLFAAGSCIGELLFISAQSHSGKCKIGPISLTSTHLNTGNINIYFECIRVNLLWFIDGSNFRTRLYNLWMSYTLAIFRQSRPHNAYVRFSQHPLSLYMKRSFQILFAHRLHFYSEYVCFVRRQKVPWASST